MYIFIYLFYKDTFQQIVSFKYSAKKLRILQTELELDEDAQADKNTITWSCRANALYSLKFEFTAVVTALKYLVVDAWEQHSQMLLLCIRNVDFIITLVIIENVLQSLFQHAKQCNHRNHPSAVVEGRSRSIFFDSAVELAGIF